MSTNSPIRRADLLVGLETMLNKAASEDPAVNYSRLVEVSIAAAERGGTTNPQQALPAQALIDGSLAVLAQPCVEERLPLEISDRMSVALHCATKLAELCVEDGYFLDMFTCYPQLDGILTKYDRNAALDPEFMGPLGAIAFRDATLGIGGAHRLLRLKFKKRESPEPARDIISRSTVLPNEIGKIPKGNTTRALNKLGSPYILGRHLSTHTTTSGLLEVTLSEEGKRCIQALQEPGQGCPAAHMRNPRDSEGTVLTDAGSWGEGTVLTQAWKDMVGFLVPDGATSNERNSH